MGAICEAGSYFGISPKLIYGTGAVRGIVSLEKGSRFGPKLMKDRVIVKHQSTSRQCSLQRRQTEGFISRRRNINSCLRIKIL